MRFLSLILLIFTAFESALAHPLGGDATVSEQLAHQAVGVHHFPLLLLILVLAVLVARKLRKN